MCGFDMRLLLRPLADRNDGLVGVTGVRLLRFANTPSWSPPKLGGER